MPGFDHFTHLAPIYDRAIPLTTLEPLLKHGQFGPDNSVLDAGGGTGRVAYALKPYVKYLVVADVSQGMLSQAAEKGLEAVKTPVESLPFASERFDRIIMIDALHHVCDQQETARELCRVLAPGGKVIIEEPDIRRFSVKLIALGEKLALMRSHFLPPEKIAGLFNGYPGQAEIVDDGTNTWIIFTKLSGKDFF